MISKNLAEPGGALLGLILGKTGKIPGQDERLGLFEAEDPLLIQLLTKNTVAKPRH
jgi:hypothetical protein